MVWPPDCINGFGEALSGVDGVEAWAGASQGDGVGAAGGVIGSAGIVGAVGI